MFVVEGGKERGKEGERERGERKYLIRRKERKYLPVIRRNPA